MALGLATLAVLAGNVASAAVIVVPNSLAAVESGNANAAPFNIGFFGLSSARYQQVFAASEFSSLSGPQLITQIAFRPDATNATAFSSTISNVQINLSTTSLARGGLSTTFAANVGADDTVVFSGSLSLSSAFTGPPEGPKDFDIVINLQTPFLYDPTAGNLLLDVRNFSGETTVFFDAGDSDTVSRAGTEASGVNSPTADFVDPLVLVTQFTTTSPTAIQVAIDIKPGGFPNSVNPKSNGMIPVAILTTATFDATTVDPSASSSGQAGRQKHTVKAISRT
jgi:hypothetical protein